MFRRDLCMDLSGNLATTFQKTNFTFIKISTHHRRTSNTNIHSNDFDEAHMECMKFGWLAYVRVAIRYHLANYLTWKPVVSPQT